jgi:hypothetical protein
VDSQNRSNSNGSRPQNAGGQRRRRFRGPRREGQERPDQQNPSRNSSENRNRSFQSHSSSHGRNKSRGGRVLTTNQVLVKYDNLLEQHLMTRKKYFEYFNRVDERQLYKLEKNFFDSIEHLRRFEDTLEPWQREALEKRKTERYKLDLTYSNNRGLDPMEEMRLEVSPEEIEDPHFKETQKEAYLEYKEDTEESVGTFEDYLKLKGQG